MTPLPAGLLELRKAVARSYDMRDGQWRPDPVLLDRLVEAEEAHSKAILAARHAEHEPTPGPPDGWDPDKTAEQIRAVAHTRPEYIEAQQHKEEGE